MLSKKSKGLFVELNSFSVLAAVTSSASAPMTLEQVKEYPVELEDGRLQEDLEELSGSRGQKYHPAHCGVYPESRFVRRHTIESAARAKDGRYFAELLTEDYRIDPATHMAGVINAVDGSAFDPGRPMANQKEVLVCGASQNDLDADQDYLVNAGIYPTTLQLGTLSTLGALMNYMQFKEITTPTLMLEMTPESANLCIVSRQQIDMCRPVPHGVSSMFPLIQKELNLKDENSARKLFYSNTFDFTEMGPVLLRKLLREMQASTGFYEVQTGQSIGQVFLPLLPRNLSWISDVLCKSLGVQPLQIDFGPWLESHRISVGSGVELGRMDARWLSLFSLMANLSPSKNGAKQK